VLEILTEMGADIQVLDRREEAGEPVADLRVRSAHLRGVHIGAERIPQTIDEFPILCVAAAAAEGETRVRGAEELRVKESDRIATMASELRKMGVAITETPDGLIIQGSGAPGSSRRVGPLLRGASCEGHGDHRVAMSVAIAGLVADGPTTIDGTACIETSFPGFYSKLLNLLTDTS
jgi:3-phosphoshikimate 1-carboxyvinyltransferase